MAISKKTGRVIKEKSAMQKFKSNLKRKHNKAMGIRKKKKK